MTDYNTESTNVLKSFHVLYSQSLNLYLGKVFKNFFLTVVPTQQVLDISSSLIINSHLWIFEAQNSILLIVHRHYKALIFSSLAFIEKIFHTGFGGLFINSQNFQRLYVMQRAIIIFTLLTPDLSFLAISNVFRSFSSKCF